MPDPPDERTEPMSGILYLEGASGISGDMTVAALLDLGGNREHLAECLKSLQLDEFDYEISRKKSYGLEGCDFDVILHHEHPHEHHGHHHHCHRHLSDIREILAKAALPVRAKALAEKIFDIIAAAEAKAHGCSVEEVHFHEVGAVDSIVDIVSAAVLIDDLGIEDCIVTGLSEGTGTVHCQHGELPVPVPAVVNIAQASGIPLRMTDTKGEMITPTGIAIAAALRTREKLPQEYTIEKIGIGLGKRDFGRPNILRAMLLNEAVSPEKIYVLECNIDDSTGEMLGFAMEEIFTAGAKDVIYQPCFMKKNRPAVLLKVIVAEKDLPEIEKTIFRCTTTIGLRKYPVERVCMERKLMKVKISVGEIDVKRCSFDGIVRYYPEFESIKEAAKKNGGAIQEIFEEAALAAKDQDV